MHSPYTPQPFEAFVIAQSSVALALTAVAWSRPSRPPISSAILVLAVWWAALLPSQQELMESFGLHPGPNNFHTSLKALTAMATLAAFLSGRPVTAVFAIVAEICLFKLTDFVVGSDWELSAFHLAYLGALIGLQARARDEDVTSSPHASGDRSYFVQDTRAFAVATLLAIGVCVFVLDQSIDSSDEWAYTFQAATFAKGHAYAPVPPCSSAFQNFWVFESMGRLFSQYTPGWPLFMAPFSMLGAPQFAAAFSLGLLVVAVARLARRASSESGHNPSVVAASGWLGATCTTFASTLLINGGSRFGHVFAAALLAWGVEAMCASVDASRSGTTREQVGWSVALGTCVALLVATRPGDGSLSAVGLGLYGVYALLRGRLRWRVVLGAATAAAMFGGLSLVILRLQLGSWFKTGYSLTPEWSKFALSWPGPGDWKWGFPLATGSYCWWPLSPAVGAAGLMTLRGGARRVAVMVGLGAVALFVFVSTIVLGRGFDWGYGPRYALPSVVAMGVGMGVALGPLWARARRGAERFAGGPATMATLAVVFGVFRLAPLVYPINTASVRGLNELNEKIRQERVHHAIVLIPTGIGWKNDGLDLTMNLPLTLYPHQDVLIAMDRTPMLSQCLRKEFGDREFYKALPGPPARLVKD